MLFIQMLFCAEAVRGEKSIADYEETVVESALRRSHNKAFKTIFNAGKAEKAQKIAILEEICRSGARLEDEKFNTFFQQYLTANASKRIKRQFVTELSEELDKLKKYCDNKSGRKKARETHNTLVSDAYKAIKALNTKIEAKDSALRQEMNEKGKAIVLQVGENRSESASMFAAVYQRITQEGSARQTAIKDITSQLSTLQGQHSALDVFTQNMDQGLSDLRSQVTSLDGNTSQSILNCTESFKLALQALRSEELEPLKKFTQSAVTAILSELQETHAAQIAKHGDLYYSDEFYRHIFDLARLVLTLQGLTGENLEIQLQEMFTPPSSLGLYLPKKRKPDGQFSPSLFKKIPGEDERADHPDLRIHKTPPRRLDYSCINQPQPEPQSPEWRKVQSLGAPPAPQFNPWVFLSSRSGDDLPLGTEIPGAYVQYMPQKIPSITANKGEDADYEETEVPPAPLPVSPASSDDEKPAAPLSKENLKLFLRQQHGEEIASDGSDSEEDTMRAVAVKSGTQGVIPQDPQAHHPRTEAPDGVNEDLV